MVPWSSQGAGSGFPRKRRAVPIDLRDESPSPPFRGEREGPVAQRREGKVGGTAILLVTPLTLPSPPDRRGEEGQPQAALSASLF
jgi:hypothetical protein